MTRDSRITCARRVLRVRLRWATSIPVPTCCSDVIQQAGCRQTNPGWKRSGNRRWQPVANEAMVATRWHLVIPEDPQLAARKPRTRLQAGGRRFEPCTAYGIEALWHLTRAPGWHYGHQGETAGRNIL